MGILTITKVDSLWWLGRYSERVFTTLKTFFPFYDECLDHDPERFRGFSDALDINADLSDFNAFLFDFMYNVENPNSVAAAMRWAFDNAVQLRPELGTSTLAYIELAVTQLNASKSQAHERLDRQRGVDDCLLTFWGALEDGRSDTEVKAFVFAGKYVERMDLYSRFSRPAEDFEVPLVRLGFYLNLLPDRGRALLADAVGSVADSLVARGYPVDIADRLRALVGAPVLDDEGNTVSAGVAVES